ncbi:triosephosphate isomerase [bacterium BMS3Bbin10]|nr:triosephosphate isomerase [bacterium BMS3Bbin10]HDL16917.1 triose-phosphate isomerase [Hyphomicrobiales bacterium]
MSQPLPLVAGNWKMNGLRASLTEAEALARQLDGNDAITAQVMICPPATLIAPLAAVLEGSSILIGGQDCHVNASGAHTGDIAAEMLADAGASAVIVGHSERRADHGETNDVVRAKAEAGYRAELISIICIGETERERAQGDTLNVVSEQLSGSLPGAATSGNTVIAYEPVWAIGTGLTPTLDDVGEVHQHIRAELTRRLGGDEGAAMRILYGGSVKPGNAAELMAIKNVNGALVGGASLKASDFWGIISVYSER